MQDNQDNKNAVESLSSVYPSPEELAVLEPHEQRFPLCACYEPGTLERFLDLVPETFW